MTSGYYITTPIYYVNASPHLGHAYTTIVADVLARFHRQRNHKTFFLTGTDEHGDKIVEAAGKGGMNPKDYADLISGQFRALWPELNISNDDFIRTTDSRHVKTVQLILKKVYDSGDIYFGSYEGHYCIGCERFYTEKELVGGLCPDHQMPPEYRKENNYFFRMSRYQNWLIDHIEKNPDFIRPERYRNEALAFLKEPLEDLCISRPKSRLAWGIPLPFDENYVTYVWFDALINYVSGLDYPEGEKFESFWPDAQHLIAKDILKPHGIYWPTMLAAAGIPPYRHLNVHGYWNIDQSKMSKTVGNVVKPLDLKDRYGLEPFRYFLLKDMVFGLDASFNEEALIQRINSDLANDLGNLVSRITTMAARFCGNRIPEPRELFDHDHRLIEKAGDTRKDVDRYFGELSFHKALAAIWDFISLTNKYVVETEPWNLAKDKLKNGRLSTVIYNLLESLRIIAILIWPVLPQTSGLILKQLGESPVEADFEKVIRWGGLNPGTPVQAAPALFPRIEKQKETRPVKETENKREKVEAGPELKPEITYDDFARLDIRAAQVIEAEAVPDSRKLIRLKIDLGFEQRTIVAGIGGHYLPAALVGTKIIVLANLKPQELMGVRSQGMLLATEGINGLTLLTCDKEPILGGRIK